MVAGNSPASVGNIASRGKTQSRDFGDRLRRLERRRPNSIGAWILGTDEDGNLIASHRETGVVRTIALKED